MKRLSELVTLSQEECEKYLSELVTNKTIYARIDRPAGIVNFVQNKDPSEILNDWSNNLTNLMTLVTKTTHLINKEEMIHRLVK
jgi:26S proteasome regulatory subunit N5